MAKIKLQNGGFTGVATDGKDTLTVGTETTRQSYQVYLLGGDDFANLGPANNSGTKYTIFTGAGNDTVTGGSGIFFDDLGNDVYSIKGGAYFFVGVGNDTYNGGETKDTNGLDSDTLDLSFLNSNQLQNFVVDLNKTVAQDFGLLGKDKVLNIENITTSFGDDRLVGNGDANALRANDGNDKVYGLSGKDALFGDGGNDSLYGGNGADELRGGDGEDFLFGGSGDDTLDGDSGKDVYRGGSGRDWIDAGGSDGRDIIAYTSVLDSKLYNVKGSYWDTITNFMKGGGSAGDQISFEAIDTSKAAGDQDFVFLGTKKFTADAQWQVRLKVLPRMFSTTKDTLIQIDTDSDSKAEMEIFVESVTGLSARDFDL